MHRRKIFGVLILGLFLNTVFPKAVWASAVDVYGEFQKRIDKLEVQLKKEKSIANRYDQFLQQYQELSDLRHRNPRQAELNELNMSLFMETLSYLPEKKKFVPKKCNAYKKQVQTMMKTYEPSNKEPFVDRALGIVDLICR